MKKILTLLLSLLPLNLFGLGKNENLTVILDWFVNPNHAPLLVAEEEGFFKKRGLNIKWIIPSDPADPPKLVAVGQADLAVDYQIHFKLEQSKGMGLTQVGTLIPVPLNCLVVLKQNNIQTVHDLKGKKIAFSSSSSDLPLLEKMLKKNGLSLKDVTLVNVHFGLTQGLLSKRVDAAIGMMRNYELIQLAQMGYKTIAFYPEENGVMNYQELIFVSHHNVPKIKIKAFLQGLNEGVQFLKTHPELSWNKFAKAHPELNNKLNHEVWMNTVSKFQIQPVD